MAAPAPSLTSGQSQAASENPLTGPAGLPPAGVTPNFDTPQKQDTVQYVTSALTITFATCAVLIRVYTKRRLLRSMNYEDYASITAWIGFIGFGVSSLLCHKNGAGTHYWNLRLDAFSQVLYWINIVVITYAVTMTFVKLSILLQYLRVFVPLRRESLPLFTAIQACIWITVLFYLTETFFLTFLCTPRKKIWHPWMTAGHCFNNVALYQASGVFNVVSDFAILLLPMPTIWKLHMSLEKKLLTMGVFATGFFACVASILRTYYTWRVVGTLDVSWEILPVGLWSWAELSIGIIVGCLPTLPRFFQHIGTKFIRGASEPRPGRESSTASNVTKVRVLAQLQRSFAKYGVGPTLSNSWNETELPRTQTHDEYLILDDIGALPSRGTSFSAPTKWPGQGVATAREDLEFARERE